MKGEISRVVGEYSSGKSGHLLLVTAGIHGNEPSGVVALQRVFKELHQSRPKIKGTLVGISGNRKALKKNVRYIDEDLNRIWTEENLKRDMPESSEQIEMGHIIGALNRYQQKNYGKRYFLDCHTTSSESLPYISVQVVNDNEQWANHFPVHIVRGFSDLIDGDIDHYLSHQGMTGFVFEGGQHQSQTAVENHEAMIWLALEGALGLDLETLSCYPKCVENLTAKSASTKKTFDIVYRHSLGRGDEFKMEAGFKNFSKIGKDQLLALHNGKEIRSEQEGHIFMPLYQVEGDDGFFIIEEVETP